MQGQSEWWDDDLVSFSMGFVNVFTQWDDVELKESTGSAIARESHASVGDSLSIYVCRPLVPSNYYEKWIKLNTAAPASSKWLEEECYKRQNALQFLREVEIIHASDPRWLFFPVNVE